MHHASQLCGNLSVETTDFCNQKCAYCNQTNKINSMHGPETANAFMDVELFRAIVDRMAQGEPPFNSFTPYWSGEPLLHPRTAEMFRYLFEVNKRRQIFKDFFMNTNGYYLTPEVADVLMDYAAFIEAEGRSRGMYITFSLDAVNPRTYSAIRNVPEHHLPRVMANIDGLLSLRATRRLRRPSLTYQFVMCEQNAEEAADILTFWQGKLAQLEVPFEVVKEVTYFDDRDAIFFRQRDEGRYDEAVRAKLLHERVVERLRITRSEAGNKENTTDVTFGTVDQAPPQRDWLRRKKACFQLWNMLVISKDGRVVPCCKDLFFELELGRVPTHSFAQLWFGERLKQLRLEQIEGKFEEYTVCANCLHPPGGDLRLGEVIEYLQDLGRLDLLEGYVARVYELEEPEPRLARSLPIVEPQTVEI